MANEKSILQHYGDDERAFVEKMLDFCKQVEDTYSYRLTTFLNPRQEEILESLTSYSGLSFYSSRQLVATEKVRVIIAPIYYELATEDFELVCLEIVYPEKFHSLTHSQILGTLLNQLGIRREFLGDIIVQEQEILLFIDQKFADLVEAEVHKIARVPVKWKRRSLESVTLQQSAGGKSDVLLLSSLRLDKVVAAAFRLSRGLASKLIEQGKVKLNYSETRESSKVVTVGQLVSVRGYGRVKIREVLGTTTQGKLKVDIELIRK